MLKSHQFEYIKLNAIQLKALKCLCKNKQDNKKGQDLDQYYSKYDKNFYYSYMFAKRVKSLNKSEQRERMLKLPATHIKSALSNYYSFCVKFLM